MTYRELYESGKARLTAAGVVEAELDARLLLEAACQTAQHDLLAHGGRKMAARDAECFWDYITRRERHMPLQYILGECGFMSLSFIASPAALIPRQDSEILVESVLGQLDRKSVV